jgi:hypothetical protein
VFLKRNLLYGLNNLGIILGHAYFVNVKTRKCYIEPLSHSKNKLKSVIHNRRPIGFYQTVLHE